MSGDLISAKTRQAFREYMVGHWVLDQISDEFDTAKIDCDATFQPRRGGQRRTLIEQYYHSVDWADWNDVKKVLEVFEAVLTSAEEVALVEKEHNREIHKLLLPLKRDGFDFVEGQILGWTNLLALNAIKKAAVTFDAKHLAEQVHRMESSIESDPALAIGTAKELIETCCKTILSERGKPVQGKPDIPALTKATLKELKLLPDDIPESARGSDVMKRILSNLGTIGNGLAELRGLYGTGHGKDGNARGLTPRHARLAVGSATTLASFLFETHEEKHR
ncbi:MAG: abortive infection family protein [Dehalococcoidia bacterium]